MTNTAKPTELNHDELDQVAGGVKATQIDVSFATPSQSQLMRLSVTTIAPPVYTAPAPSPLIKL